MADLLELKGESSFKVGAYRRAADVRGAQPGRRRGCLPRRPAAAAARRRRQHRGQHRRARRARIASRYHERLAAELPPTLLAMREPSRAGAAHHRRGLAPARHRHARRSSRRRRARVACGSCAASARAREERILEGIARHAARPRSACSWAMPAGCRARLVGLIGQLPGRHLGHGRGLGATAHARPSATSTSSSRRIDPAEVMAALDGAARARGASTAGHRPARWPRPRHAGAPRRPARRRHDHATGSGRQLPRPSHGLRGAQRAAAPSRSPAGLVALRARTDLPAVDGPSGRGERRRSRPPPSRAGLRTFASEAELYAFLGLAEIPPELREGRGEVEAAAAGTLPTLVPLRGPARRLPQPLRLVGRARAARGHGRVGASRRSRVPGARPTTRRSLTHRQRPHARSASSSSAASSASSTSASPASWPRASCPRAPIRMASGSCTAASWRSPLDGRLDYDDALLAAFDVVVASLHVGRRQPRAQLMARYEVAMRNPHVDIISHPSGRKIGRRPDLDLDWEAFYRLAAETGTLLEVNGSAGAPRPRRASHPRRARGRLPLRHRLGRPRPGRVAEPRLGRRRSRAAAG